MDTSEPPSRPTLRSVAKAAHVSVATASSALNGKAGVSEQTRQRVLEAAVSLNYRPNASARTFRLGTASMIGLQLDPHMLARMEIAPLLFSHRLIAALTTTLAAAGLSVTQLGQGADGALPPIAALVLLTGNGDATPPPGLGYGVPLIVGGPWTASAPAAAVLHHDHQAMTREVLDHLTAAGSRSPGLVRLRSEFPLSSEIEMSYRRWCADAGIRPIVTMSDSIPAHVAAAAERCVRSGADAIYNIAGPSDSILAGISDAGKHVPDDVLVVALAEGQVEDSMTPTVSTMSMQGSLAGAAIARAAMAATRGEVPGAETLSHRFTARQSSTREHA